MGYLCGRQEHSQLKPFLIFVNPQPSTVPMHFFSKDYRTCSSQVNGYTCCRGVGLGQWLQPCPWAGSAGCAGAQRLTCSAKRSRLASPRPGGGWARHAQEQAVPRSWLRRCFALTYCPFQGRTRPLHDVSVAIGELWL